MVQVAGMGGPLGGYVPAYTPLVATQPPSTLRTEAAEESHGKCIVLRVHINRQLHTFNHACTPHQSGHLSTAATRTHVTL